MMSAAKPAILLLVPDLTDASVARRVAILRAGGAEVSLAGFRRSPQPVTNVGGCIPLDLGQTFNTRFVQRMKAILSVIMNIGKLRSLFDQADLVLARNLEMLAIAVRGKSTCNPAVTIIYEVLDIHRLLLGNGLLGTALRWLEGRLSRRACAVITSSPAFIREYFERRSQVRLPVRLVENKLFMDNIRTGQMRPRPDDPPWVIGWFGILRCRKSLELLARLVLRSSGKIKVIMRGKPALDQIKDFYTIVENTPGLSFEGTYRNPQDLEDIYGSVHFTWAIDMYEEGLNSSWLLPNRLYEGGAYGAVPLALESVETGRFINRLAVGITLADPLEESLEALFSQIDGDRYRMLAKTAAELPPETWIWRRKDCIALVNDMASLHLAPCMEVEHV